MSVFVHQFQPANGDFGAAIQDFLASHVDLKPLHFVPLSNAILMVVFADQEDVLIQKTYPYASAPLPSAAATPSLQNNVVIALRNTSGGTILKGKLLAVSGIDAETGRPTVLLADKDDSSKRPAVAVTTADVVNGESFDGLIIGTLSGVDTSAFALTDQLVLGDNGAFARPPLDPGGITSGEIQYVGSVAEVGISGKIFVNVIQAMDVVDVNQVGALQGTSGTPTASNRFVTGADSRLNGKSVTAEIASDTTTTSTSFVDLLTVPISVTTGNAVLAMVSFGASNATSGASVFLRLVLDGVARRGVGLTNTPGSAFMGGSIIQRFSGLSPGTHTLKLQWRVSSGTGQIRPVSQPDAEHANLVAMDYMG